MIKDFRDHAANERTYLAWIRTGVTITIFGFVVEKFELFLARLAASHDPGPLSHALPDDDVSMLSLFLVITGIGIIMLGTWHFVRNRRAIDHEERFAYNDLLPAYLLSGLLVAAGGFLLLALMRLI